jgi:cobalt/nickel transport system permease protein
VDRRPAAIPHESGGGRLMGAGQHRPLTLARDTRLARLAPECKVLATVLFVFVVVATPREAFWAFGSYAVTILVLARAAQLPLTMLARRLVIELPFLAFALVLPIIGHGARVEVLGISLSVAGLWAAWNIVVKGTLGIAATSVLVATTDTRDILRGLERLHVPSAFVAIASFMLRYLEVIAGEMRAMRVARASRGYDPRWLWQARAVAASAGTLFVRSYERGERVYLAMAARGYDGTMPPTATATAASPASWAVALLLPAGATVIAVLAWAVR